VDVFRLQVGDRLEMTIYDITPDVGVFAELYHVKAILPLPHLELHGGFIHPQSKRMTLYGQVLGIGDRLPLVIKKMLNAGDIIKTVVDVDTEHESMRLL
jgi:hypothetical protein